MRDFRVWATVDGVEQEESVRDENRWDAGDAVKRALEEHHPGSVVEVVSVSEVREAS